MQAADAHKKLSTARWFLYLLAVLAATIFLQGSARLLGPAGVVLNFLTPLPSAFLQMQVGFTAGLVSVVASALILSSGADPATGIAYVLQFGILSLVLPLFLRRGYAWDRAALGTLVVVIFSLILFAGGLASVRGESLLHLVSGYVSSEVDSAIALYSSADMPSEQVEEFRNIATKTAEFLLMTWPALLTVFTGVMTLVTISLLSVISGGRYVIPGIPFHRWKSSEVLVWLLILSGFTVLFSEGATYTIGLNVLTVLLPIYFLHGIAIVTFFFRKKEISLVIRAFGYFIAIFLNPLPLVVTGLGVFDLWADFRKPRIKKQ